MCLLAWGLVLAVRPVADDGFWWELSRGRAVLSGSWSPSAELLADDVAFEADWLGGAPFALMHGFAGINGLMILKLLAVGTIGWILVRQLRGVRPWLAVTIVMAALLGATAAWEPSPLMLDVLALAAAAVAIEHWRQSPQVGDRPLRNWRLLPVLVVFVLWANFAPRVLLGILVLLCGMLPRSSGGEGVTSRQASRQAGRRFLGLLGTVVVAVVVLHLTPRGLLTSWDSLRIVVPRLAADAATLQGTVWQTPSWTDPATLAFAGLSLAWLSVFAIRGASLGGLAAFAVVQLLGWSAAENVALASVWCAVLLADVFRRGETVRSSDPPSHPLASVLRPPIRNAMCGLAVLGLLVGLASDWGRGSSRRLGWGLAPELEPRLLAQVLDGLQTEGTAFSVGVRAAGMLTWLQPTNSQANDVPVRALLGNRLREQRLIEQDLIHGWRTRYRRSDETWGGWWTTLQERKTTLLLVPAEHMALIRGLEPTVWRPISLDSPVIAFARAGDAVYAPRIVATLQQQELVDRGAWSYALPSPAGSDMHLDLWGVLTGEPPRKSILRQAGVFRAMNLHVAALRILHPLMRERPNRAVLDEFALCQRDLAYRERLMMGRPSQLRQLAWLASNRRGVSDLQTATALNLAPTSTEPERFWSQAIDLYLAGRPVEAGQLLQGHDPETLYARAWLTLESGDSAASRELFRSLLDQNPDAPAAPIARDRLFETE